jgi:hypothetical protein
MAPQLAAFRQNWAEGSTRTATRICLEDQQAKSEDTSGEQQKRL